MGAFLLLAPAAIGFALFYLAPAIRSVYYSFTDSTLLVPGKWIGLDNYAHMLSDSTLGHSILVTAEYTLINIVVQTVLALTIAVTLDRLTRSIWLRALLLIPWLVPGVTVGLLWQWILDPSLGVANSFLTSIGLPAQQFLNSTAQAMPAIALVNTWRYVGYVALLFFAGLQLIPRSLYEAASLDGAGEWRMFRTITIPLLRPIIGFVLVTTTVGSLQVFDIIQVTTKGGPVDSTDAFYPFIFRTAFTDFDLGYASAVAVAFMVVIAILTFFSMRLGRANESEIEGV
ncbi:carbohydrate ABC transporter permease [Leifsonia naganoensis]|uniref:Multiple sugar transport system permease protein n=1 Tax=Leifsonia naganoensis TaxID=150025 RepID=A0A853DPL0_9MICO|nr:sugar ABC transporter permease [Leifsonia naganoensis]NYK09553.1 multiple sugar transport system permease protein [Leifsonia naganoensis]